MLSRATLKAKSVEFKTIYRLMCTGTTKSNEYFGHQPVGKGERQQMGKEYYWPIIVGLKSSE